VRNGTLIPTAAVSPFSNSTPFSPPGRTQAVEESKGVVSTGAAGRRAIESAKKTRQWGERMMQKRINARFYFYFQT
jgi:hypothetical protein